MKTIKQIVLFTLFTITIAATAQVGIGTTTPNASAQLDVNSSSKGFLPPRMNWIERNAILNPVQGLQIYCTNCGTNGEPEYYNGSSWTNMVGVVALPQVTIGNQIWQSTNYEGTTYRDGTPIPQVTDPTAWMSLTTGAWCYYNNDSANGTTYGKLYNWYAVVGIYDANSLNTPALRKQFAPMGWHVSTDAEWTMLTDYLGGLTVAGTKMKETGTAHWSPPNTNASNSSGFTGLPGGLRNFAGGYSNLSFYGHFWSSIEYNGTQSSCYWLDSTASVTKTWFDKHYGFSVRCLKD